MAFIKPGVYFTIKKVFVGDIVEIHYLIKTTLYIFFSKFTVCSVYFVLNVYMLPFFSNYDELHFFDQTYFSLYFHLIHMMFKDRFLLTTIPLNVFPSV